MRILTVCRSLGLGGTERAAEIFILGYVKAGWESAVLNLGSGGPREENLRRAGVTVFRARDDFQVALAQADRFAPDIVHIHRRGQEDPLETAVLERLRSERRRVLETNVFAWADYSPAARLVDVHLHLSRWCLWAWRRRLGRRGREKPAVVLPNPVDPRQFQRASAAAVAEFRAKWAPDASLICGRIGQPLPGKWHVATLGSFAAILRAEPKAFLLLIGLPQGLRARLKTLPSDVRARVRELPMTASNEELCLFYSSLDCFLHAANQGESFGYTLAEAMMCGCPVVTVSQPLRDNSQVEVVGHMHGGIVAGSMDFLADAVLKSWRDKALRAAIQSNCRHRIVECCDVDHAVAQVGRIAALALASDHASSLRLALDRDPLLTTSVAPDEIVSLAKGVFGAPRWRDLALLNVANSRFEHRLRQALRRAFRR